jgi:hypothetical protein
MRVRVNKAVAYTRNTRIKRLLHANGVTLMGSLHSWGRYTLGRALGLRVEDLVRV